MISWFVPICKLWCKIRAKSCIKNEKYDCIISMGSACFVATALKNLGLRQFSGPFDWMFGSTFSKRFDIFLDKFAHHFDKEDLHKIGNCNPVCDTYENRRTGLVFNHDFPVDSDFDTEYPIQRAKYDRRIQRVLNSLSNGHRGLVIYAECKNEPEKQTKEKLISLIKRANEIYKTPIDLLCLQSSDARGIEKIGDNLFLAKYEGYIWDENEEHTAQILEKCLRFVMQN